MAIQTCLEKRSITARHEMQARSDYNEENQYSGQHKDALADGDVHGKGTGAAGHGHSLPNCNAAMGQISYSNFDTDISSGAGNSVDNETRNTALARSLYNQENVYSASTVTTEENLNEGQYRTY